MRIFYLFFLFSLASLKCFSLPYNNQYVSQEVYHYVTIFRFNHIATHESLGYVIREKNKLGSFYQIYDERDQFLGSAEDNNNTGSWKATTAILKLYDFDGREVGTIKGDPWTTQPAKFILKTQSVIGYAYLSNDKREFEILDTQNKTMMYLYRNVIANEIDSWEVHISKDNQIPDFIIKAFTAFISDTHGQFIKDN